MFLAGAQLKDDEYLLVIGLSAENRRRLDQGMPIRMSRGTHGIVVPAGIKVVIFTGETEETMRGQMADLIGATTVIDQKDPH